MNHNFYCKSCGTEVEGDAEFCPECGRIFTAVRCPQCGFTGAAEEFEEGCPHCSYRKKKKSPFQSLLWMRKMLLPLLVLLALFLFLLYRQL